MSICQHRARRCGPCDRSAVTKRAPRRRRPDVAASEHRHRYCTGKEMTNAPGGRPIRPCSDATICSMKLRDCVGWQPPSARAACATRESASAHTPAARRATTFRIDPPCSPAICRRERWSAPSHRCPSCSVLTFLARSEYERRAGMRFKPPKECTRARRLRRRPHHGC